MSKAKTTAKPIESPRVVNVVVTGDARQLIDLARLCEFPWGRYDPEIYPAGYIKDEKMLGRVTVFASGKLIGVGTKSITRASEELKHATKLLTKAGLMAPCKIRPKIRNIVSVVNLNRRLDLAQISERSAKILYEPEQFPGAVYHPSNLGSVCILLFASPLNTVIKYISSYPLWTGVVIVC